MEPGFIYKNLLNIDLIEFEELGKITPSDKTDITKRDQLQQPSGKRHVRTIWHNVSGDNISSALEKFQGTIDNTRVKLLDFSVLYKKFQKSCTLDELKNLQKQLSIDLIILNNAIQALRHLSSTYSKRADILPLLEEDARSVSNSAVKLQNLLLDISKTIHALNPAEEKEEEWVIIVPSLSDWVMIEQSSIPAAENLIKEIGKKIDTVGLFRVEGSTERVSTLLAKLEENPNLSLQDIDVRDLTTSLKRLLKNMKFLRGDQKQSYLAIESQTKEKDKIQLLRKIFSTLSSEKKSVLQNFCQLCLNISKQSGINQMTPQNLAIAVGTSLIEEAADPLKILEEVTSSQIAFQFLLKNYRAILA